MHDKEPKKIKIFSETEIMEDLEKYRKAAIALGAADAVVVPSEKVYVDMRVRNKCMIPKCPSSGKCANCPPHSYEPDYMAKLVDSYKYAVLAKMEIPPDTICGKGLGVLEKDGKITFTKTLSTLLKKYRQIYDIVTEIESMAFYDGHYHAVAFGAGDCNAIFCHFAECAVLKGGACRFPLRARPSMEGCSIDVYRMVAEAGWDIYPIGMDCNPENIPHGTLVGLVLVH